jgi:hypothetical protein
VPIHRPFEEPCGGLPKYAVNVFLSYCVHHQAWFLHVEIAHQQGDEHEVISNRSVEFGPFDGADDVVREGQAVVNHAVGYILSL